MWTGFIMTMYAGVSLYFVAMVILQRGDCGGPMEWFGGAGSSNFALDGDRAKL
jgi:preprotein translocase subunit SecG